ncbi:MAG: ribosome-binding factor A [Deltaproteobacteria bacterium]|nr:MAG: ribosome-binding factor A [Deltaproteobacteria bacterium]
MSEWSPKQILESIGAARDETKKRPRRVAVAIRQELSVLLVGKTGDPRLRGVSVSRVEVTDDVSLARVFFTVPGGARQRREAEKGFRRAAGFFRSHIAEALNLKFTPQLQFFYDDTADKVAELEAIFREIADERNRYRKDS